MSPEILGGTAVFVGTRVPVLCSSIYLDGGETLDEFLKQFPGSTRAGECGCRVLSGFNPI